MLSTSIDLIQFIINLGTRQFCKVCSVKAVELNDIEYKQYIAKTFIYGQSTLLTLGACYSHKQICIDLDNSARYTKLAISVLKLRKGKVKRKEDKISKKDLYLVILHLF